MAWFWQRNSSLLWNFSFNFICMSFVAVGRSLMIVSYVAFKMAALWFWTMFNCNPPIAHCHPLLWGGGILVDHWSTISSFQWPHFLNGCLVAILDFSVSGWHGFGSITQVCFGISVSNFMCMSFVAVGRSLRIVSYVSFEMAALWFWAMFNCNPPIAHWHPLLWGGGILVDHWSTISSFSYSGNMKDESNC